MKSYLKCLKLIQEMQSILAKELETVSMEGKQHGCADPYDWADAEWDRRIKILTTQIDKTLNNYRPKT